MYCGVNACGEYLILSYGREHKRIIPDIFNPMTDWTSTKWFVTNDNCTGPMICSRKENINQM